MTAVGFEPTQLALVETVLEKFSRGIGLWVNRGTQKRAKKQRDEGRALPVEAAP